MENKKKKKRLRVFLLLLLFLIVFTPYFLWYQNHHLVRTDYIYSSELVSDSLSGFRIVQISDLHNEVFGKDSENLVKMVRDAKPDIIVFTGDIVDSRHTDFYAALLFTSKAVEIAPCYYVTGNHEWRFEIEERNILFKGMMEQGVNIIEDMEVDFNGFTLVGISDASLLDNELKNMTYPDRLEVALCHKPQYFDFYSESDADLILSGHAHGGQFRLPFIGPVLSPGQGFFPKLAEGMHELNGTTMIVSRGLGNSRFPFRLFNYPEVVVVTLERK